MIVAWTEERRIPRRAAGLSCRGSHGAQTEELSAASRLVRKLNRRWTLSQDLQEALDSPLDAFDSLSHERGLKVGKTVDVIVSAM